MSEEMKTRPLATIARDIQRHWGNVYYAAVPYLEAMGRLDKITDTYGFDTGEGVVRHFLVNASTWRGADARRVKAELKALLGEARR